MPLRAWETLERRGVLRGDGRRIDPWWRARYRWMMEQMRRRLPGYRGGYPIWAWVQPKPDLRRAALLPPGTPGVRVEWVASAAALLLSDFDAWHAVLNEGILALSAAEDDEWERRVERATGSRLGRFEHVPSDLQDEVRRSWERIFDLEALRANDYCSGRGVQDVQAVTDEIRLDRVVATTHFVAR